MILVPFLVSVSIVVAPCPNLPEAHNGMAPSCYVPQTRTIYIRPDETRSAYVRWHETMHAYDYQLMTDRERARALRLMGYPKGFGWWDDSMYSRQSPGEQFADSGAACILGRINRLCRMLPKVRIHA